jgi:hypothetical protein
LESGGHIHSQQGNRLPSEDQTEGLFRISTQPSTYVYRHQSSIDIYPARRVDVTNPIGKPSQNLPGKPRQHIYNEEKWSRRCNSVREKIRHVEATYRSDMKALRQELERCEQRRARNIKRYRAPEVWINDA